MLQSGHESTCSPQAHDDRRARIPADRDEGRHGAERDRRPGTPRSPGGGGDRQRRSRPVLASLPEAGLPARARAPRRPRSPRGPGVPGALEYRGGLMSETPAPDVAREWLQAMTLIRRFEE